MHSHAHYGAEQKVSSIPTLHHRHRIKKKKRGLYDLGVFELAIIFLGTFSE